MFDFNIADGKMNGFELAVLQSEEYPDEIIKNFTRQYNGTQDPNFLLDSIVEDMDIDDSIDLVPESVERIKDEISNFLGVY